MSQVLGVRNAIARRLPPPVKAALRAILPARLVTWVPPVRRFHVAMPSPPAGLGPVVRERAEPSRVAIEADSRSLVPRLLDEQGIACYEPETMASVLAAISYLDARDVFDIGANVGVFSIVIAATTSARVTAFEPTPELAATFRGIAAANGLGCELEPIALGATTGSATLFVSSRSDSSNSLRAGFRTAVGTVEVPVERLDDYVARTGRAPGVLKLDTETTEPDVLAGSLETLRRLRPWIACEVLADRTEAALMAVLRPLGYRFHHLDGRNPPVEVEAIVGDRTYDHRDWLFTPDPIPAAYAAHYAAWLGAIRAAR